MVSFSVKSPADAVFTDGGDLGGVYLMDDGSIGVMQDFDECDDDYGDEYVGEALIDCWYPDGTSIEGGCYAYIDGQSLKDWCDLNEYPLPERNIPDVFGYALQDGADPGAVFDILSRYLAGTLDDDGIGEALAALV